MKENIQRGKPHIRRRPGLGEAGYSLIQALTFVAVASVLAAVGAPKMNEIAVSYELRSASRQLYGELQRARAAAVMRNTSSRVSATGGDAGLVFELYDVDAGTWQPEATNHDWGKSTRAITLGGLASVEFQPDGTAESTGTIWISAAGHNPLYIYVSPSGRIRML